LPSFPITNCTEEVQVFEVRQKALEGDEGGEGFPKECQGSPEVLCDL